MAITDKTRKTLWGRSGNRCSICRVELVHDKQDSLNVNVGEECHIVSSRTIGPRHRPLDNYDTYENLLLLCRNHHTTIDQNVTKYPESELQKIKANHERWIKETIDEGLNSEKQDIPDFLSRITSGKDLMNIINSVHGYKFDHDEPEDKDEATLIGNFLDLLKEWGDNSDVLDNTDLARIAIDLKVDIDKLEKAGFFVFGQRTKEKVDHGMMWNIAVVHVLRKDNPIIIKVNLKDVTPPQSDV